MSKTSLVLTILGPDRPGLVEQIARLVADHNGNWLESRMAHVAGHFAGILRVEVDADQAEALSTSLAGLAQSGLDTIIHPDPTTALPDNRPLVHLDVMGQDRPGIVREISRVLASLDVNVEELATECRAAAETGQPLFHAEAQLRLPPHVTEATLRQSLEAVAADLMVDVKLATGSP
jgi:glycine cleavage system regulatory protein